uniref:C2H2-type domain-containing protein n=1 Tax=Accipiter nisus TaxID=211598 RepID=A0A8B9MLE9_9AVES
MTRLQKARRNRINARKVRQRSKERKSDTKKKESKYEKFFIKIERDFTPLDVPVTFSCKLCLFASSNPRVFIHHMKGHKERPPYQCPQCDYSCISLSYLLNHMYWHAGYKLYQCRFCTFLSLYFASMVRHSYIHTGAKPYSCEFCQSAFTSTTGLKRHRSLIHIKNGYEFGHCLYADSHLENLELHHEIHVGLCPEGDFGSSAGSTSVRSLLGSEVCGVQPDVQWGKENDLLAQSQPQFYQCAECEYTTYILSNLELHVRTHTGEKPYTCSVCQKKFRTSSHLKRHKVTHFNMEHHKCRNCDYSTNKCSSTGCLYNQKQLPVKTYTCEECGYSTAHNGNLKPHLRIHTGEKPFKCSQCAVAFRTSSHLKRHLLTHLKLHCRRCKFSTADKRRTSI